MVRSRERDGRVSRDGCLVVCVSRLGNGIVDFVGSLGAELVAGVWCPKQLKRRGILIKVKANKIDEILLSTRKPPSRHT